MNKKLAEVVVKAMDKKANMEDIEVKIKKEKDYFIVYMGTADSSGVKEKCNNSVEIAETIKNYVESRLMEGIE